MAVFDESSFENALIDFCVQKLGYNHVCGYNVERDFHSPFYDDILLASLRNINPKIPEEAINQAIFTIRNRLVGSLVQKNVQFTDYLQNGVEISIAEKGKIKNYRVILIDFENPSKNIYCIANQWTFQEFDTRRPDIIIFINGLPLVVMELKSCTNNQADISDAYLQLRNYMNIIPSLFNYNAFCIISDMLTTKAGTITADETRFMAWKTVDGTSVDNKIGYQTLLEGMLQKDRFIDILHNFIIIEKNEDGDRKILAAYHQYHAVKKATKSVLNAIGSTRKGGVFWHTQGSGKSLSMLFLTHILRDKLSNPTIVVITDRNDLDGQLYLQFSKCAKFLRENPKQADSSESLTNYLSTTTYGGIFFTTMQKFEEQEEPFSLRDDIIIMADEAHRSQYGLVEQVDRKSGKIKSGYARTIRDALPNATFIGFTGTPISEKDRDTEEVFGKLIDVYDMTQAVEDGATRPVYYENRVMRLNFDDDVLSTIDNMFDSVAERGPGYKKNMLATQKRLTTMESLLNAPATIDTLVRDIIAHYETREDLLTGKAMIVAYSRTIAISIYKKILELRPDWTDKVKVVMTSSNKDPEEWNKIIGNKRDKIELAKKFKDDNDPMKIAIVVDMWLTGFDVPSLATMYIFKHMAGHNLMQAIARVNRVFKDKEGGLVVDYIGLATALKEAMSQFTKRDNDNYGDMDISKTAYVKFCDYLESCLDIFYGFNVDIFCTGTDSDRAVCITNGLNFIFGKKQETQDNFMDVAYKLRQAASLCQSIQSKEERYLSTFFESLRISINKLKNRSTEEDANVIKELSDNVRALLNQSVKSKGIINLFGNESTEFSIFDSDFLEEVAAMNGKNLAAELLKRLLADKIHEYKRSNVVQAELFSKKMEEIMHKWRNMLITNAEVIEELLKLAEFIKKDYEEGNSLGLSPEEKAFYDALTKPEAVRDFYKNSELVALTRELTDTLRRNWAIDWNKKQTARASMRVLVKKLLRKYKYPPSGTEEVMTTIFKQCESWSYMQMR